jgi:hypothetical protein
MRLTADQARLRPHLRGPGKDTAGPRLGSRLEEFLATPESPAGRTGVPSPGELRGLPVVGSGPGAIAGTNPVGALLAKERRRR